MVIIGTFAGTPVMNNTSQFSYTCTFNEIIFVTFDSHIDKIHTVWLHINFFVVENFELTQSLCKFTKFFIIPGYYRYKSLLSLKVIASYVATSL